MIADVAHGGCPEQGIAKRVDKHVGITVAQQSEVVLYLYATQPKVAAGHQLMYVVTESYSHLLLLLKKSLMPSKSNASDTRSVWSSGLLGEVAMV